MSLEKQIDILNAHIATQKSEHASHKQKLIEQNQKIMKRMVDQETELEDKNGLIQQLQFTVADLAGKIRILEHRLRHPWKEALCQLFRIKLT